MIESRCGILCAGCEYREPMQCNGCVNINKSSYFQNLREYESSNQGYSPFQKSFSFI
jgi:hypothetical protein